jgi:hypothetical protein
MEKILIFLSATALLMPLSVEAKAEAPTPDFEASSSSRANTKFTLRGDNEAWILQGGWLRLRAKRENNSDYQFPGNQRREPSHGVGLVFTVRF